MSAPSDVSVWMPTKGRVQQVGTLHSPILWENVYSEKKKNSPPTDILLAKETGLLQYTCEISCLS